MKKISNFLSFVEIQTKTASQLPLFLGFGLALYSGGGFDVTNSLLLIAASFLFDMTVTAINNHIGKRQEGDIPHYSSRVSLAIILIMGITAAILGLFLAYRSNLVVLLIGVFCFFVGVIYTFGPLPIARTPFGEAFCGLVQGICIPLLTFEVNHLSIINLILDFPELTFNVDILIILFFAIACCPMIFCIANIMLANNLCDLGQDAKIGRYTLPFYIGEKKALTLFKCLYTFTFISIPVSVLLGAVPFTALVALFTIPAVRRNVRAFSELQDKAQTFHLSIKNFLRIGLTYIGGIWIGAIARNIFF